MILGLFKRVRNFIDDFFNQSVIHGFSYLGSHLKIHVLEKLFWFSLICTAIYFCVECSLVSWNRYLHKSTVVSVQVDFYFWNTSLPSLTICPMDRLDPERFEVYAMQAGLTDEERDEIFPFLESLANSTYVNFQDIKNTSKTDQILEKMGIKPADYMKLIYDLTEDMTVKAGNIENKVRNIINMEFIRTTQTLTENGICYTTNSMLALNVSTSMMLKNEMPPLDEFYDEKLVLHNVKIVNLFDGDMYYSFIGFPSAFTVYVHSPYETMNIARTIGYTEEAYEFEAFTNEIITSDQFRTDTFISQRNCRFSTESNLTHYAFYSKNLCLSECRLNLAMKHCGCIPFFFPNKVAEPKPVCSYHQLKTCFPEKQELFHEFREMRNGREKTIDCKCLQNCVDSNVVIERYQHLKGTKELLGSIGGLMVMRKYPLIRFQREVIFTLTDFFVSIGGAAGFFIGSSVLGLIEILYFFSLRFFWYTFGKRS